MPQCCTSDRELRAVPEVSTVQSTFPPCRGQEQGVLPYCWENRAENITFQLFFSLKLLGPVISSDPFVPQCLRTTQFMGSIFNYCCWNFCSTVAGEELSTLQIICMLDISFYKQKPSTKSLPLKSKETAILILLYECKLMTK